MYIAITATFIVLAAFFEFKAYQINKKTDLIMGATIELMKEVQATMKKTLESIERTQKMREEK